MREADEKLNSAYLVFIVSLKKEESIGSAIFNRINAGELRKTDTKKYDDELPFPLKTLLAFCRRIELALPSRRRNIKIVFQNVQATLKGKKSAVEAGLWFIARNVSFLRSDFLLRLSEKDSRIW